MEFIITVMYMGEEFSVTLDSSIKTESDVLEIVQDLKKERFETQSGEDIDVELDDTFDVIDWGDSPPAKLVWEIGGR